MRLDSVGDFWPLAPVIVIEADARQPARGRGGGRRVELEREVVVLLLEPRGQKLRVRRSGRVALLRGGEDVRPPPAMLLLLLSVVGRREAVSAGGGEDGGALPRVRRPGILLVLK